MRQNIMDLAVQALVCVMVWTLPLAALTFVGVALASGHVYLEALVGPGGYATAPIQA